MFLAPYHSACVCVCVCVCGMRMCVCACVCLCVEDLAVAESTTEEEEVVAKPAATSQ